MSTLKERERDAAREDLRQYVNPGDTVYTTLKHVSRSGMYRVVDVYVIRDNEPLRLSYSVAVAIGFRYDRRHEGVGVSGCGMDVGFEVVYNLSHALFADGFGCIGPKCPSNDHSNGDRDYTPHRSVMKDGYTVTGKHWHRSGGYALNQRWLG